MRKINFVLIFLFISVGVFSQQRIKHSKCVYRSPEGKLFINKALPVYLHLSTSPDENAKKYLLMSEDSKKYTNPMYFDTEGYNTVRSPSKVDTVTKKVVYPKEDIIFEVYTDSRAPYTQIERIKRPYIHNGKWHFSGNFKLNFNAKDQMSGVKVTYYSIDGADYKEFSEPVELGDEKEYLVQYYSVDNVGNEEKTRVVKIVIDKTKPHTEVIIKGRKSGNVISGNCSIGLNVKEGGAGVKTTYFRFGKKPFKVYKYPSQSKWFGEGEHMLSYYSVDNVGNKEDVNTFNFYVDKTPPVIVEEIQGNTFIANGVEYSSGRSKFKIVSMDNKAGIDSVFYRIGKGKTQVYSEPFYLKGNSGTLKISTWAYDKVGNKAYGSKSSNSKGVSFVDLVGPKLKYKFKGPFFYNRDTVFISQSTKVQLIGVDNASGFDYIMYSTDNSSQIRYKDPFLFNENGLHTINYIGFDKVGNSSQKSFFVVVDNSAPKIHVNYSIKAIGEKTALDKKIDVYPNDLQVFISATDDLSGLKSIFYKVNNGKQLLYSKPLKIFKSGRDYKLNIKAVDKLNNSSNTDIEFSIN